MSLLEKIMYALGGAGGNGGVNIVASFLMAYYTDTALIAAASLTTMFILVRLLDGVSDVFMGVLIDKTDTKIGKARPWVLASAPLMLVFLILVFNVPMGLSDGGKLVYAYITYILLNCVAYTINNLAHNALLARISKDPTDRVAAGSLSYLGINVLTVILSATILGIVSAVGWKGASIILGMIAFVCILLEGMIKERNVSTTGNIGNQENISTMESLKVLLKNKYFYLSLLVGMLVGVVSTGVMSDMVYYCNWVLEEPDFTGILMAVGSIPALIFILFIPMLSKKFTKRQMMLIGSADIVIFSILTGIFGDNKMMVLITSMFRGMGQAIRAIDLDMPKELLEQVSSLKELQK